MAGNLTADNSGNILVEFDYNNIIVVDPNKTVDDFGVIAERLVDHENLVMYVNLEAEMLPRTKLAVGGTSEDRIRTISVGKINFLKPSEGNYLGTGYYDELTGRDTTSGKGKNQKLEIPQIPKDGSKPYIQNTVANPENVEDNGLLGITAINIRTGTSFIPSVTISLEDVQGKALFELGQNSPYAAFFNLPYPVFYLTLKGYYGQAIRYQLNLLKFNARFNSYSGNYSIELEFVGYKFNILNELPMGHLLAAPHMYATRFNVTKSPTEGDSSQGSKLASIDPNTARGTTSTINVNTQLVTEKGYQKIVEVYSEYKAKGLIPRNFPELTIYQLMNKLENFEKQIAESYPKANITPLTNIRNYKKSLESYLEEVRGGTNSWFGQYCNPRPIVLKDGRYVYAFKKINNDTQVTALSKLKDIILLRNAELSGNPTLGSKGTFPITNPINEKMIVVTLEDEKVDWIETAQQQYETLEPTVVDIIKAKAQFPLFEYKDETNEEGVVINRKVYYFPFFLFEGKPNLAFEPTIYVMQAEASKKLQELESIISAELARKIEDTATGLGFTPNVRSIMAVIMASAEGFIRLLDDCHTKAWDVKYDPIRKNAILNNNSSVPSSDKVDDVEIAANAQNDPNNGLALAQIPVYPWPQFFVETPEDKKGRFQLKYLGDPSVVNLTKAYLYEKWPEVEFVEEYMKGLTQKFQAPLAPQPLDNSAETNIINYVPLEFPNTGIAYSNKEEIKFFYEIWERQFVSAYYNNFGRIVTTQNLFDEINKYNLEVEGSNLITSLGLSSPYLVTKLKNYNLNSANYQSVLYNISNLGTGKAYQDFIKGFYVTPYLKEMTEFSNSILNLNEIGRRPSLSVVSSGLETLAKSAVNTPQIIDTYPFVDTRWCSDNLSSSDKSVGQAVYNTNKVLKVFPSSTVISNFEELTNYSINRPVTNFFYLSVNNPSIELTTNTLVDFYKTREPKIPTEGYLQSYSPNPNYTGQTTTSILNTPYFVNAIQSGVQEEKNRNEYPYIQAAYLFLNSLPLASLRERFKSEIADTTNDLDYIAACLKKFAGVHKLPYPWILKFGAIWHRYKKFKQTGVDILDSVWKDFNYNNNFDPIGNSVSKEYVFNTLVPNTNGELQQNKVILQTEDTASISIQLGFYPKLINDFNYFYNGNDLYSSYSNTEIQTSIANGMRVFTLDEANLYGVTQNTKNLNLQTFSVVLPAQIETNEVVNECVKDKITGKRFFIIPSFGSQINQIQSEVVDSQNQTRVNLTGNEAMYNGSVRLLWASPNYGYFEGFQIKKPGVENYINEIYSGYTTQAPFALLSGQTYSTFEEMFSVFDKEILDEFEIQFLDFSRSSKNMKIPSYSVTIGESLTDPNAIFTNFQAFFKTTMVVEEQLPNETYEEYFNRTASFQIQNFTGNMKAFMEYDKLLRFGNPSFFDRRVWLSYLSEVDEPIDFGPYEKNSLPTAKGNITLVQSKSRYPQQWLALELEVGFSTIPQLRYKNTGSYITDFFVDNNIDFTVDNITLLSPLIKMYATYKLLNQTTSNSTTFKNALSTYLSNTQALSNQFLNDVMRRVQAGLPEQQEIPERTIQTVIDGQQSKVENYEMFKALNDKWIAGSDYKTKTLFEDMLFMDRASRNIGETIFIDIFDLRNFLSKSALNMDMSVYTLISSILMKNNFVVMPLPAYVNFYNVQDVSGLSTNRAEGSLEFANNLWGTFLNVDYRNSGPKMVAFYTGKPSNYLNLPKGNFRFRDDGFEMRRSSQNPLLENPQGKKDFGLSNRCVGFNVDIGTRNQNIFYSFQVSQENGKATSESINTQLNMIDQSAGRNTATQNVSLYNLYKQRSYECTIQSLGNAMIQPTMYFNLRHVPMFNGPYMITEVSHSIQPGNFETTFKGIRQGMFDLPSIDSFIQSVNKNLLTKVEQLVLSRPENTTATPTTNNNKAADVVQTAKNTLAAQNTCESKVFEDYKTLGWAPNEGTKTEINPQQLADIIKNRVPNNEILQFIIYTISYVRTFVRNNSGNDGTFVSFNNNFATITLDNNYGEARNFFDRSYCCMNVGKVLTTKSNPLPVATFTRIEDFVDFMKSRLENNITRIKTLSLPKYYVCNWPVSTVSESYYDENINEFIEVNNSFVQAKISAEKVGLKDLDAGSTSGSSGSSGAAGSSGTSSSSGAAGSSGTSSTTASAGSSGTTTITCQPPTITSFTPSSGVEGTIVKLLVRIFIMSKKLLLIIVR